MYLSKRGWSFIKIIIFFLCLSPFLLLINSTIQDQLGANPIQALHFNLGDWALRFLCIGLALKPLKRLTKQSWPLRFRRMMGLFTFFYASSHFLVYIVLDLSLSWEEFVDEVPKSPYILVGLFTYLLLIALAITSTKAMQKRLGKRWVQLHKLVYVAGISAVIHYLWLVKSDIGEPLIYASIMFVLLGFRLQNYIKNRKAVAALVKRRSTT
ncbi:MAG: sulfoxide reductase heme-binding subunit YedZ [Gammaproteobacteria bacterium]|jgi:methionine sulfoxide reductase heme-binding subunit|nr:sulfoxide reductase heme-binding subunit YedZ [Gammaproteobacteria bacterium]MBT5223330.1 sulfoxide reductase heme-binding subunit YedZ [Gammaproteobacteria bacterium]MBT5825242.1 sulfoxide reductase heme-binding subunit YedZ [Gammaproteobacteria bacterium]MBT5967178.1 sulfoxide reductase heme-binding subunit YedZ [Gammaproteobacteria bacterium]MBT6420133.1 sulfoxide reductase heme-binding subunit YedZ [Gammaproteobacteria bacterium]